MTEVISVKFKNRGKSYFFDPNGMTVNRGDSVVVETSKGLELAVCSVGNHPVEDTAVVQPLRSVVRVATEFDLKTVEKNKKREREAYEICRRKIAEHGLDMKLSDVEYSFEGNKITFYFTSDGRVDFRELVRDLASVLHNRIELRQVGVRDEAKLLGGLGLCGYPFCCSSYLEEFQPVSTKMAKVQSMSLNPTKISGTCGRLMCCLRYEQEAYEDLVKSVPKVGAYVQTVGGYGTVTQVNLLRQLVKVKLDNEDDGSFKTYPAGEVAAVPGGRPRDGEVPPSVLNIAPAAEEDGWSRKFYDDPPAVTESEDPEVTEEPVPAPAEEMKTEEAPAARQPSARPRHRGGGRPQHGSRPQHHDSRPPQETKPQQEAKPQQDGKPQHKKSGGRPPYGKYRHHNNRPKGKPDGNG